MKTKIFTKYFVLINAVLLPLFNSFNVSAQENENLNKSEGNGQVIIEPLFEYIIAPDELPDLRSKTDYLMDHFWDPFDFKKNNVVDQNALNHAFGVYVQAMPFASEKKVEESVKKLIDHIKGSPTLTYQFAKAAEENLYGPRADLWSDQIYLEFIKNVINNKKVKDSLKKNFKNHYEIIKRSSVGTSFQSIKVKNPEGSDLNWLPTKEITLIEFTPFNSEDFKYSNLRLDISALINEMLESGRLEVNIILLQDELPKYSFPEKWNVYYAPEKENFPDIKIYPSFYVIGKNGKIEGKNLTVDDAINLIQQLAD